MRRSWPLGFYPLQRSHMSASLRSCRPYVLCKHRQQILHVLRKRGIARDWFVSSRMSKGQLNGMQGLAAKIAQRFDQLRCRTFGKKQSAAVHAISNQGVPDMRHVNANLV